jgi:oligopeptidase B
MMSRASPTPPLAKRIPHVHEAHGDRRPDEYHWLRDRDDPDVEAYLEAENAYADAVMGPLRPLQEKLYAEIVSRIQETDLSVPVPHGPFLYYSRSVEGLQYPIHCRRTPEDGSPEQILIDENVLAEGQEYCALGAFEVSPDHCLLAWSLDTEGDEDHVLRIRDMETGEDHPEAIPGTSYGAAWASDNRTVFYTTLDESRRPWRVWRHRLGTDPSADVIVHQEDDDRFFCSIERTRSGGFLVIDLRSAVTSETRLLRADDPQGTFTILQERRQEVEYGLDHHGDRFFIMSNEKAPNFRLVEAPVSDPSPANWREIIPHSADVKLEGIAAFAGHLVVLERAEAVRRLRVIDLDRASPGGGGHHVVEQPEAVSRVGMPEEDNPEFDRGTLRYTYTSLVTPQSIFDYDLDTRERTLLKQEPVLGGYDPEQYETRRLWATASDGARVPISLVAKKGIPIDGSAPCVLYGYGSYEASSDPRFSSLRLSLLDRGFVWAIGHIRGGGEMGRAWYEAGKLAHKMNTFTDFIACAEHLVEAGWTASDRLAILGGSAGGLLVGAAVNLRPDLFRAVVAEVPFVDVVSTISDPTLPLSVIEWEEWGNPADPEFYATMKAYSPYDNVRPVRYPDLFVTAGLNDPRVSYWEPAKWVARLRTTAEPGGRILLRTEMGAGHGGPSGRYDAWRKEAEIFAFLLDAVGLKE